MSALSFRRLLPFERQQFADHLKRLGKADRLLRFEILASDTFIDDYVNSVHLVQDAVFGAFDDDLILRGAAHVAFGGKVADLGISVEDTWRGQGTGTKLLDRSISYARLHRAEKFTSMCLTQNSLSLIHI